MKTVFLYVLYWILFAGAVLSGGLMIWSVSGFYEIPYINDFSYIGAMGLYIIGYVIKTDAATYIKPALEKSSMSVSESLNESNLNAFFYSVSNLGIIVSSWIILWAFEFFFR